MDFRNSRKEPGGASQLTRGSGEGAVESGGLSRSWLIPLVCQNIIKKGWTRQLIKSILDRVNFKVTAALLN